MAMATHDEKTHADDDEVLLALEMRRLGKQGLDLANALGMTPRYWTALTNLIRTRDVAESGETRGAVMGGYW